GLVDVDVEHLGEVAQLGVPGRVGADGHRLPGDGIEGLVTHVGVFRHPQVAARAHGGLAGRLQLAGAVATAADHALERARPVEHADVVACPVGDVDPVAGLVDGDPAGVGADDAAAEIEHLGAGERPGVGAVVEGVGDVHPAVLVVDVDAVHAGDAATGRHRYGPRPHDLDDPRGHGLRVVDHDAGQVAGGVPVVRVEDVEQTGVVGGNPGVVVGVLRRGVAQPELLLEHAVLVVHGHVAAGRGVADLGYANVAVRAVHGQRVGLALVVAPVEVSLCLAGGGVVAEYLQLQ